MIRPELPDNETQRQAAVERYQILDTLAEESYDNITSLMAYICDAPISLITLLDNQRNFLKSHHGVPFNESPRDISFCGHAINSSDVITIVEDARVDVRFEGNPLVSDHEAIFYAGVPLVDPNGYKLGTLCVYDHKPRKLDENQQNAMITMSKQVMILLEQRYQNLQLLAFQEKLEKRNQDLQKFASLVSHDLKSPLSNIIAITNILEDELNGKLNSETLEYLEHLKSSSKSLKQYIDDLLEYYRSEDYLHRQTEKVTMPALVDELIELLGFDEQNLAIGYIGSNDPVSVNKAALMQILVNLVSNAAKYNSKSKRQIDIKFSRDKSSYHFEVSDNGDGISPKFKDKMFELFSVGGTADRHGKKGSGIGLATVQKLVSDLGGDISVNSTLGEGTTVLFSLARR